MEASEQQGMERTPKSSSELYDTEISLSKNCADESVKMKLKKDVHLWIETIYGETIAIYNKSITIWDSEGTEVSILTDESSEIDIGKWESESDGYRNKTITIRQKNNPEEKGEDGK